MMRMMVKNLLGALFLLLTLAHCAPHLRERRPPLSTPVRVLLTNDDGIAAPGLAALRRALAAYPGEFQLTVVAPKDDSSGAGMSVTTRGTIRVQKVDDRTYTVAGTPADCVLAAVRALMAPGPDLVLSGANFGQNLGGDTLVSGTVGAAMTAAQLGIPAVAVSVGIDPEDIPATKATFPAAAEFVVRLLRTIRQQPDMVAPGTLLNVNYPPLPRAQISGVRVTRQGRTLPVTLSYGIAGNGDHTLTLKPRLTAGPTAGERQDADVAAFSAHFITITPLDADCSAAGPLPALPDQFTKLAP